MQRWTARVVRFRVQGNLTELLCLERSSFEEKEALLRRGAFIHRELKRATSNRG